MARKNAKLNPGECRLYFISHKHGASVTRTVQKPMIPQTVEELRGMGFQLRNSYGGKG
jgi:hypothetical protein